MCIRDSRYTEEIKVFDRLQIGLRRYTEAADRNGQNITSGRQWHHRYTEEIKVFDRLQIGLRRYTEEIKDFDRLQIGVRRYTEEI